MKINIKDKKVVASIVGIITGIVIISNLIYLPINGAENKHVDVASTIINLKSSIKNNKEILLEANNNMKKINSDKEISTDIEAIINQVGSLNDLDNSKINDNIKILDTFNKELDKMVSIYDNDDNMKKDLVLTNNMEEVKAVNKFIDILMKDYNSIYSVEFNNSIKKIPVNIVAKSKGWYTVDKFSSI